jgi:hypothetical protein
MSLEGSSNLWGGSQLACLSINNVLHSIEPLHFLLLSCGDLRFQVLHLPFCSCYPFRDICHIHKLYSRSGQKLLSGEMFVGVSVFRARHADDTTACCSSFTTYLGIIAQVKQIYGVYYQAHTKLWVYIILLWLFLFRRWEQLQTDLTPQRSVNGTAKAAQDGVAGRS